MYSCITLEFYCCQTLLVTNVLVWSPRTSLISGLYLYAGNNLLPDDNKPLPEVWWTYHQWSSLPLSTKNTHIIWGMRCGARNNTSDDVSVFNQHKALCCNTTPLDSTTSLDTTTSLDPITSLDTTTPLDTTTSPDLTTSLDPTTKGQHKITLLLYTEKFLL